MHAVVDQEAIYARVIGLLISQRDLDLHQVLSTELTAYPPSMFLADGQMRVATGKSTLKNNHIWFQYLALCKVAYSRCPPML